MGIGISPCRVGGRDTSPAVPAPSVPLGHHGQSPAQRSQLPDLGSGIWDRQSRQGDNGASLGMGQEAPALRYLDQVCRWSPSLLEVLLPMLLLHFEGKARAQDPLGTGGDEVCGCWLHRQPAEMGTLPPQGWIWPLPLPFLGAGSRRAPLPGPTHSGQREEGDAEQGKAGRQHPSQPRLRRLVPIADGGEGDLPGGRAGGGLEGAPPPRPRPTLLIPSRGWGAAAAELTVPHHRESA